MIYTKGQWYFIKGMYWSLKDEEIFAQFKVFENLGEGKKGKDARWKVSDF